MRYAHSGFRDSVVRLCENVIGARNGTVEALSDGVWKRLRPGSVLFNASNALHGLRNVGTTDTISHVINGKTPAAPKD